jgi:hypothetical protein
VAPAGRGKGGDEEGDEEKEADPRRACGGHAVPSVNHAAETSTSVATVDAPSMHAST